MKSHAVDDLLFSSLTFRHCLIEKTSFIVLNLLDLVMTVTAANMGMTELNPVMAKILSIPWLLISFKIVLPAFFAWLIPGKWLWPAIALMGFVVCWDCRELLLFLHAWPA